MKVAEKVDTVLEWVWDVKKKISKQTKKMSAEEYILFVKRNSEKFIKKNNLNLKTIY